MYIEQQSVFLDIRILLLTLKTIFIPESTEGVSADTAAPSDSHKVEPNSARHDEEKITMK